VGLRLIWTFGVTVKYCSYGNSVSQSGSVNASEVIRLCVIFCHAGIVELLVQG